MAERYWIVVVLGVVGWFQKNDLNPGYQKLDLLSPFAVFFSLFAFLALTAFTHSGQEDISNSL